MFDWIAGFINFWSGSVAAPVRDMVNQIVHAVAGWIVGIIHGVQDALAFWVAIINWCINQIESIFTWVGNWFSFIWNTVLPYIYGRIEGAIQYAFDWAQWLIARIDNGLSSLENLAWSWIQWLERWVYDNIWAPLKSYADAIWNDLVQWGYTAFWWITHPENLARALLGWLIVAAEDSFDLIAVPVGAFVLRIIVRQTGRFLALLEAILAAVI